MGGGLVPPSKDRLFPGEGRRVPRDWGVGEWRLLDWDRKGWVHLLLLSLGFIHAACGQSLSTLLYTSLGAAPPQRYNLICSGGCGITAFGG